MTATIQTPPPGPSRRAEEKRASKGRDAGTAVTILLPTFNRAGYIAAALRSALDQTRQAHEIIVIDDGSTDATARVVAQFAPRVRYLRQENSGKLPAIARGLDHATGDLVWVMDDDDLAAPDALETLARPFSDRPDCVLSYGRMSRFRDGAEDRPEADEEVPYPLGDDRPFFVKLMEDCFVTGHPCVMVRRSALEAMRPFDDAILASVDYYLHLGVARTGPAAFVDRGVLRQRQHAGARGPRRNRYGEADRNARWIAHDAYMFRKLLPDLPLRAYLEVPPVSDAPLAAAERRQALLQKAVIEGRKKLWDVATPTFAAAMAIEPDRPLAPEELRILAGMLGSRYGIDELYRNPAPLDRLRQACAGCSDPAAVLSAASRPLLHQIKIARRERSPGRAGGALRAWRHLMDFRSTARAVLLTARRQIRRKLGSARRQDDRPARQA